MKQSDENLVNIFDNGIESCKMIIIGLLGFIRFPIRCIDFALITLPILIILCLVVLNVISQQELNINCFEFIKLLMKGK